MASAARAGLTAAEYLERERRAQTKSEYLAGEVFAMAGATRVHNLVVANLVGELRSRLRGGPCEVYPSDMRVAVQPDLYTYPDVTLACGDPAFLDERQDTLLDPVALFEVLSETTEAHDRGLKFEYYRSLPSLREYLLVATSQPRIERFRRTEQGWVFDEAVGLHATLSLSSVAADLPLAEVYARVAFAKRARPSPQRSKPPRGRRRG